MAAGGQAELRITKALDVKAEHSEEELSRQRGAIKGPGNNPLFDLVTLKCTFQVTDQKSEPVDLRIRHDFTGEVVSAEGSPDIKKTAKGLRDTNPSGRITWNRTLKPGEKLTLSFTYDVYVRS